MIVCTNNYINNYCVKTTVGELRNASPEKWLEEMTANFHNVHDSEAGASQKESWADSLRVLQETLKELPETYDGIHVLFEYVLPRYIPKPGKTKKDNGVRPDVLMISDKTIVVLEFKRREERYPGCESQARKYHRRIQQWHKQSVGMNKKVAIVFTLARNLMERHFRLWECSPEKLGGILIDYIGEEPGIMDEERLNEWINSDYEEKKKKGKSIALPAKLKKHHIKEIGIRSTDLLGGTEHTISIEVSEEAITCREKTYDFKKNRVVEEREYVLTDLINQWIIDMDKIGLAKWVGGDYTNPDIMDGGDWTLSFRYSDEDKSYGCDGNTTPEGWSDLYELIDRIRTKKNLKKLIRE